MPYSEGALIQNVAVLRRQAREMDFSRVVLPEPDSPTIPSTSPGHSSERHVAKAFARRIQVSQVINRKQRFSLAVRLALLAAVIGVGADKHPFARIVQHHFVQIAVFGIRRWCTARPTPAP